MVSECMWPVTSPGQCKSVEQCHVSDNAWSQGWHAGLSDEGPLTPGCRVAGYLLWLWLCACSTYYNVARSPRMQWVTMTCSPLGRGNPYAWLAEPLASMSGHALHIHSMGVYCVVYFKENVFFNHTWLRNYKCSVKRPAIIQDDWLVSTYLAHTFHIGWWW